MLERLKIGTLAAVIVIAVAILITGLLFGLQPTAIGVIAVLALIAYFIKPSRSTRDSVPPYQRQV